LAATNQPAKFTAGMRVYEECLGWGTVMNPRPFADVDLVEVHWDEPPPRSDASGSNWDMVFEPQLRRISSAGTGGT
jgi:hypothetical protein